MRSGRHSTRYDGKSRARRSYSRPRSVKWLGGASHSRSGAAAGREIPRVRDPSGGWEGLPPRPRPVTAGRRHPASESRDVQESDLAPEARDGDLEEPPEPDPEAAARRGHPCRRPGPAAGGAI